MLLAMLCPNSKINSSWSFQALGKCCAVVRVATLWLCNQMWQFYLILPGLAKMKIHDHQDQTQTERDAYLIKQLELSVHYVVLQILPRPNS